MEFFSDEKNGKFFRSLFERIDSVTIRETYDTTSKQMAVLLYESPVY